MIINAQFGLFYLKKWRCILVDNDNANHTVDTGKGKGRNWIRGCLPTQVRVRGVGGVGLLITEETT